MKSYFVLQYRRFLRGARDIGLNPFLAFCALIMVFVVFSFTLYEKIRYADYLYPFVSFILLYWASDERKDFFLKNTFGRSDMLTLKCIENLILSLPFFLFAAVFRANFFVLSAILIIAVISSFVSFKKPQSRVIPTPFSKNPFEFLVGFRKTFLAIFFLYLVSYIGIGVGNFKLSTFPLLPIFLVVMTYYTDVEPPFYVWIYNCSPSKFLKLKVWAAIKHFLAITLPVSIPNIVAFSSYSGIYLAIILLISLIFIPLIVLVKYVDYPGKTNVPQTIKMVIGIFFPPLLFYLFPYFYSRSRRKIKPYLNDTDNLS